MAYEIEIVGLNKLQSSLRRSPQETFNALNRAISTSVYLIRPILADEMPTKTGKMKANVYTRVNGLKGEVGPNLRVTPYAWFVHQGTSPYTIRPKTKKALYWEGAPHPVALVHHPGIKANPFVKRAFNRIKIPVRQVFEKEIDKLLNKLHT